MGRWGPFLGQTKPLQFLLALHEHQVVTVLCIIFQQYEIWGRFRVSGETFCSETFSVGWLYGAFLLHNNKRNKRNFGLSQHQSANVELLEQRRFTQRGVSCPCPTLTGRQWPEANGRQNPLPVFAILSGETGNRGKTFTAAICSQEIWMRGCLLGSANLTKF